MLYNHFVFDILDALHKAYENKVEKIDKFDVKEYKKRYYREHIEEYRARNKINNAKWNPINNAKKKNIKVVLN